MILALKVVKQKNEEFVDVILIYSLQLHKGCGQLQPSADLYHNNRIRGRNVIVAVDVTTITVILDSTGNRTLVSEATKSFSDELKVLLHLYLATIRKVSQLSYAFIRAVQNSSLCLRLEFLNTSLLPRAIHATGN